MSEKTVCENFRDVVLSKLRLYLEGMFNPQEEYRRLLYEGLFRGYVHSLADFGYITRSAEVELCKRDMVNTYSIFRYAWEFVCNQIQNGVFIVTHDLFSDRDRLLSWATGVPLTSIIRDESVCDVVTDVTDEIVAGILTNKAA